MDSMQANHVSTSSPSCGACGMNGHQSSECLQYGRDTSVEEVNAFNAQGAGNPYPNNFNSNWRNPARFAPSGSNFSSQPYQNQNRPPSFQAQVPTQSYQPPVHMSAPQKSRTDELLEQLLMSQQKREVELDQKFQQNEQKFQQLFTKIDQMQAQNDQIQAHNRMLESQIAQLSTGQPQRNYGKLPSQPEANPREGVNAVILRRGKQLEAGEPARATESEKEKPGTPTFEVSKGENSNPTVVLEKEGTEKPYVPPPPYQPPLPFPQRIQKAKLEKQYGRFLANLQKLSINVPFLEALSQMPSYARFLKELLSNKRNLGDMETVASTKVSNDNFQNTLPQKLQDPGSFSIPCSIGKYEIRKALCDLGASVSLIPLSICEKLRMGSPKLTNMTLQMADRSIKHPVGIFEDVPLKVGKFFIPVDFVVLDMEEDVQTPIILGRPFLATAGAMIDMKGGRLIFRIGDETAEFNIFLASKFSITSDSCFRVDDFDRLLELTCGGEKVDELDGSMHHRERD